MSVVLGIQPAYIICTWDPVPTDTEVPKHLMEKSITRNSTLHVPAKMHIEELKDSLYTIIAYSKTLKQKLRFVIWVMLMRTTSFFSTKTSISG